MKPIFISLLIVVLVSSCKKEEIVKSKPYNIEYKIIVTPLVNSNITGAVSYISKTSTSSPGNVSNLGWSIAESNWNLNVGDKIGFTASVGNFSTIQASIIVDGITRVFQNGVQTMPANANLNLFYIIE